ncbi:hypothetical protein QJS10_CPB11g01466 [Acorus calamus]|uniref:Uncharacterized protein n=1 Tax=Acorus calamus TaxID=4465 RepID=A0AAV9DRX0_ACOCL|nr:hypothetical protein QJS10_CPB11g01466 [Acorus calamus]
MATTTTRGSEGEMSAELQRRRWGPNLPGASRMTSRSSPNPKPLVLGLRRRLLAPPPEISSAADHHPDEEEAPVVPGEEERSPRVSRGLRSDFAENGGRFRMGISMLSSNLAVAEITKITSSFLPLELDVSDVDDDLEEGAYVETEGAVGVTEEVLAFARNISRHPEIWLDFPLLADKEDRNGNHFRPGIADGGGGGGGGGRESKMVGYVWTS